MVVLAAGLREPVHRGRSRGDQQDRRAAELILDAPRPPDHEGRKTYDGTFAVTDPPAPDGQIPAKFSVRGIVPFEVPVDAVAQYIRLQGNITANGALVKMTIPKAAPAP